MDFNGNKAIYLQITDIICDRILSRELKPGDRIPSVRDAGADFQVNPNTIVRSYEKLTDEGIIYNRRGIGYFIAGGAFDTVLEQQRREFIEQELPQIKRRLQLLDLNPSDIF